MSEAETGADLAASLGTESYREANLYARSIYEQFYKHATISFAFNAILITAIGYITGTNIDGVFKEFRFHIIFIMGILGVLYNCGALLSFIQTRQIWYNLHNKIYEYESEMNDFIKVQEAICGDNKNGGSVSSKKIWGPVSIMTCLFFGSLITLWLSAIIYGGIFIFPM